LFNSYFYTALPTSYGLMSSILLFVPLSVPFGPKGLKRKLVETSNLWGYILLAPVTDPCRGEGPVVQVTRILIGAPKKTTDKLQRVLNSAARIVSNTRKFDRGLTHFRRSQLHWLDVVDRVRFRVCVQVFRCLHKMAPEYLTTYCQPVSGISGRRHLRSADRGHLNFPRVKLASYGGRSFAFAGPSNWNSLPAHLRAHVFLFHLLSATSKPFSSLSTIG